MLLAAIALCWGANWTAIKIALAEIPVWQHRSITCGLAGTALLTLAAVSRQRIRVPRGAWASLLLGAALNVTVWQVLSAYGVRLIASGDAAVLAFTMPIWATLLGVLFLRERITPRIVAALLLTLGGILDLLWPALKALGAAPQGMLLLLGAALSWAIGTIVQKRTRWPLSPITVAGWQLVIGTVPMALVALGTESFALPSVSAKALWAMAYSFALSMTFGQYAWFKVLGLFPVTVASISTVMVPVVGVIMGAAMLGEPLGWREVAALLCVTSAITLVLIQPRRKADPATDFKEI